MATRKLRDKPTAMTRREEQDLAMWLELVGEDTRVSDRDFRNLSGWALSGFHYDTRIQTFDLKSLHELRIYQVYERDPIAHVVRRLVRLNWLIWHTSHGRTRLVAARPPLHETHPEEFNRG